MRRYRWNKFKAVPTVVDGKWFPSKREANRYRDLRLLEADGQISNLRTQVKFSLEVNGIRVTSYRADFVYNENGQEVIEDAKGVRLEAYSIKRKLMKACLGKEIREI